MYKNAEKLSGSNKEKTKIREKNLPILADNLDLEKGPFFVRVPCVVVQSK